MAERSPRDIAGSLTPALLDAMSTPYDPKHSREDLAKVIFSLRETESFAHLKVHRCESLIEDMCRLLRAVVSASRGPMPISEYRIPEPVHPHAMTFAETDAALLAPETTLLDAIPHVLKRADDWKYATSRRDLERIAIEDLERKYSR